MRHSVPRGTRPARTPVDSRPPAPSRRGPANGGRQGGPLSADDHVLHALDLDDVALADLPAAPLLGLAVDPDRAGQQHVLHLGAGRDGVHQLEQLSQPDGVLPRPQLDGAHVAHAVSSSPTATVPGRATSAPIARNPSRSRWMVLRTPLSRPIPPGCGRVTMTQRSTCLTTSSSAPPRRTRRPTSASSLAPSRTPLARHPRRSHPPPAPVGSSAALVPRVLG